MVGRNLGGGASADGKDYLMKLGWNCFFLFSLFPLETGGIWMVCWMIKGMRGCDIVVTGNQFEGV